MDRVAGTRVGCGRGKLILFGEHAAVYGYPAIGIPLDWCTRVQVTPADAASWELGSASVEDAVVLRRLLESLAPAGAGGALRIESTVPRGVGFGSSAALCVAMAAAFGGSSTWEAAHRAESLFHGTPSGIDTGLALLDGMRLFRPHPPALPHESRLPDVALALVVGWVPRRSNTASLVGAVRANMICGDGLTMEAMASLGRIAEQAVMAIGDGPDPAPRLGMLADRAQGLLASLGLSTPELDALLDRGRSLGALGGKLSGAGGGGAFYLVARDVTVARRIAARIGSGTATVRAVLWAGGVARAAEP